MHLSINSCLFVWIANYGFWGTNVKYLGPKRLKDFYLKVRTSCSNAVLERYQWMLTIEISVKMHYQISCVRTENIAENHGIYFEYLNAELNIQICPQEENKTNIVLEDLSGKNAGVWNLCQLM